MLFILYFECFDFLINPLSNCYSLSIDKTYTLAVMCWIKRTKNRFMSWYTGLSSEFDDKPLLISSATPLTTSEEKAIHALEVCSFPFTLNCFLIIFCNFL